MFRFPLVIREVETEEAGEGVEGVEEVILKCSETTIVHWNTKYPAEKRYQNCNRETDVLQEYGHF